MEKYNWIVAVCNTSGEGVDVFKFRGNKQEMKERLVSLIKEDRENANWDTWEHGTESTDEIVERSTIKEIVEGNCVPELYGYGCYYDYHIDYTAIEINHIKTI